MKRKVQILMSTYNGSKKLKRQVKSIMGQIDVDIYLKIRDDGSDRDTVVVLEKLKEEYKDRIQCLFETNIGWKRSFMKLLFLADDSFDYYGFSDQDDIWFDPKVISCINLMEMDHETGIKLSHCCSLAVDENLTPRTEQERKSPCPPSHKAAITTEYFQGCGMLWNNDAMKMIKEYAPKNKYLAHDYWVGIICYYFGKIYFCSSQEFYHIRYTNNSSQDGNVRLGRIKRLRMLCTAKNVYMNPVYDLINGYGVLLSPEDKKLCSAILHYKTNIKNKIQLIIDPDFSRPSILATLLFKFTILINRF